jgi:Polyketide cyclase / dehydrase and lipid transport
MRMQITSQTTINAPASDVWRVIAHQFDAIGQWASSIPTSYAAPETSPPVGAEVGARVCATGVRGFKDVREQFISYDEETMLFAYEATAGLPWIVRHAENHWQVFSLHQSRCAVAAQAVVDLRTVPGLLLAPLLRMQMHRVGQQTFEELKYYVEHGRPHPRKAERTGTAREVVQRS